MRPTPTTPQASGRRVILVTDEFEMERLSYEAGGAPILLAPNLWPLRVEESELNPLAQKLDAMNLLTPGNVLIQNPYDPDDYSVIEQAVLDFTLHKHHLFVAFCGMLGAKSVSVDVVEVHEDGRKTVFKAEGGHLAVKGTVEAKSETCSRLTKGLTIHAEFKGGPPDIPGGQLFLSKHRLLAERHLNSLLEMRSSSNQLIKHRLDVSVGDAVKSNMAVAGVLKCPGYAFSANISQALSSKTEFKLSLEVRF